MTSKHHEIHTEDIQDIISAPPHGLLRWGITWILIVFMSIVVLAAFIRYPDVVVTSVRINASNAPKAATSRVSGNLVTILVDDGDTVITGQQLAWMESTADHSQVLGLLEHLLALRKSTQSANGLPLLNIDSTSSVNDRQLGELQESYQSFYQYYLNYLAATDNGIYLKQRTYIQRDIDNVDRQRAQLQQQWQLRHEEYILAEKQFDRYKELADRKVISPAEYQEAKAKLLASKHPLEQTESALLTNEASRTAKIKELVDIENRIIEEKSKFMQALNSLISEVEQWKHQYVLTARLNGVVTYAGFIQPGQYIEAGQEVFHINPGSTNFFGVANIPQYNMGKVQQGQKVLVKLNSYPFEQYGILNGRVAQLNKVPYHDSIFLAKVDIEPHSRGVQLTTGMRGTAEIITEEASLLQRLLRNINKVLRDRS